MIIKEINKSKAEKLLNLYFSRDENYFFNLSSDYDEIRTKLTRMYKESVVYKNVEKNIINEYGTDVSFALKLYEYFNEFSWFNEAVASNYNFWAYICVCVVPDIVEERHGNQTTYFYAKNVRMYIPTLWWYIHMSYQNDIETTYECIRGLNTDYILQLVERPGRDGTFLSISRKIMYYIGKLPKNVLETKIAKSNLLRRVLIQNTSKLSNYNLVFDANEELYVKELFLSCGVNLDEYVW